MNAREKFAAALHFERGVPVPKSETSYWIGTVRSFIGAGMPVVEPLPVGVSENAVIRGGPVVGKDTDDFLDKNICAHFGLDPYMAKFPFDISPRHPRRVLEEDAESVTYMDSFGRKVYEKKANSATSYVMEYPVENMADFDRYRESIGKDYRTRLPEHWDVLVEKLKDRDYPIRLGGNPYGFYGTGRELMGDEGLMVAMYEEPELVHAINRFYLDMMKDYWSLILKDVQVECAMIWEDFCYNLGCLISKEMFREFMEPYYLEIVDFFHQYGVKDILVDSDGFVEDVIPQFVRVGVTGMYPFEINCGNDLLRIREAFPRLQLLGGVNKRVLMTPRPNFAAIDAELAKVPILLRQGGFIPHVDHSVPEGATFENFTYYRNRLNEMIDREGKV